MKSVPDIVAFLRTQIEHGMLSVRAQVRNRNLDAASFHEGEISAYETALRFIESEDHEAVQLLAHKQLTGQG